MDDPVYYFQQDDARSGLGYWEDQTFHCCVTSPPYWGLRDYGHSGQIGLEKTPEEYVSKLVDVFQEVRRVLRDDGTLWLVIADSYTSGGREGHGTRVGYKQATNRGMNDETAPPRTPQPPNLKPKDLVGIPWLLAFALRADGWYLRSDIIWAKPNPMPESVRDRPTKSHEYLFLLSKSEKYYYDTYAIMEPTVQTNHASGNKKRKLADGESRSRLDTHLGSSIPSMKSETRNRRSVWTVSTKPYRGAHFAVFPESLIEPCILAGSPVGGWVLDPFSGSGTVAAVSKRLGRKLAEDRLK